MPSKFSATGNRATPITVLHDDVISTHILTKLDGPTLASAACASAQLHTLCGEENLWANKCMSTWKSIRDPRVISIISTFQTGYRSFFFDAFPSLHHHCPPLPSQPNYRRGSLTTELISAVDLKYQNVALLSKVEFTKTWTHSFLSSPFWIELVDSKSPVTTPVKFTYDTEDTFLLNLEQHTKLSWIVIDPTCKRAANLSSLDPVLVIWDPMNNEVRLRYATVTSDGWTDHVEWRIEVTCGVKWGRELIVKEMNMEVVDMDGSVLRGEDGLVILREAMERGVRKIGGERKIYREFMERRRGKMERGVYLNFVYKIWWLIFYLGVSFFFMFVQFM